MTDEADEFAFFDSKIEILDDDCVAFRRRINLREIIYDEIIAHALTSISFTSRRRIGFVRPPSAWRGSDKSSGSMSGKINFFVSVAWCSPFELSKYSMISRRISLKRGS